MKKIIIGICTYKRPKMLAVALQGILNLKYPISEKYEIEIIIIDNDIEGTAKEVVENFAQDTIYPVHYHVESQKGLSSVRNRLLQECYKLEADFLAGCDDDDVVDINWLQELLIAQNKHEAVAIAGPWFNSAGSTPNEYETASKITFINTGNYLIDLSFVKKHQIIFNVKLNDQGCEDSDFSLSIAQYTDKIFWESKAIVREQLNLKKQGFLYECKRAIAFSFNRRIIDINNSNQSRLVLFFKYVSLWLWSLISLPIFFLTKMTFKEKLHSIAKYTVFVLVLLGCKSNFYKKVNGC